MINTNGTSVPVTRPQGCCVKKIILYMLDDKGQPMWLPFDICRFGVKSW